MHTRESSLRMDAERIKRNLPMTGCCRRRHTWLRGATIPRLARRYYSQGFGQANLK